MARSEAMEVYTENGHVWIKKYMEGWWKQELHDPHGRFIEQHDFRTGHERSPNN